MNTRDYCNEQHGDGQRRIHQHIVNRTEEAKASTRQCKHCELDNDVLREPPCSTSVWKIGPVGNPFGGVSFVLTR